MGWGCWLASPRAGGRYTSARAVPSARAPPLHRRPHTFTDRAPAPPPPEAFADPPADVTPLPHPLGPPPPPADTVPTLACCDRREPGPVQPEAQRQQRALHNGLLDTGGAGGHLAGGSLSQLTPRREAAFTPCPRAPREEALASLLQQGKPRLRDAICPPKVTRLRPGQPRSEPGHPASKFMPFRAPRAARRILLV